VRLRATAIIPAFVLVLVAMSHCTLSLLALGQARPPEADETQATVYFYRYKQFVGSSLEPPVYADEVELARMDNGRFFAAKFEPGVHTFRSSDRQSGIELKMEPGEQYFIRVEISPAILKGRGRLVAVPPEQGAFEIRRLEPLGPGKVKDRSRVIIAGRELNPDFRWRPPRVPSGVAPARVPPTAAGAARGAATPPPGAPLGTSAPTPTQPAPVEPAAAAPASAEPDTSKLESASREEEAPSAEPSTIVLKSTPDGADIMVDGKFMGSTPSTVRLTPGDHTITIERSGYRAWQRTMSVNPGGIVTVDATLERNP
jgi:hypothetical protein